MAKIGEGHAAAMARQGLHELQGAMYSGSNIAQRAEYGIFGTLTPGEVAEDRRSDARGLEDEQPKDQGSILGERLRQAESRGVREDRGMERER